MKKIILTAALLLSSTALFAGKAFLGYLYPSGGQRGTTVRIIAGGQGLGGRITLLTDNPGIKLKSAVAVPNMGYFQPPQRKWLTQFMRNLYSGKAERPPIPEDKEGYVWRKHRWLDELDKLPMLERSLVAHALFVRPNALQAAPSIASRVLLEVEISPDAPTGPCRLRLVAGRNISNEKLFFIGSAGEISEQPYYPPITKRPPNSTVETFPAVLNGQIMPGETDIFTIKLEAKQNYTFTMRASELSPYLGDAVPGHFQGILSLRDKNGNLIAFADDEYHHPDPVLRFTAAESGTYTLHISDSIKRGRADFVYRIEITEGNIPFKPYRNISLYRPAQFCFEAANAPKIITPSARKYGIDIKGVLHPDYQDSFKLRAVKGETVVCEIFAAGLDSPLDSVLTLQDENGKIIAENDDTPQNIDLDLNRRQTDSLIMAKIPADGIYTVTVSARNKFSGDDHFYTLQLRAPAPSVTAVSGMSVLELDWKQGCGKMRFHIQRRDGFKGDVVITSPQLTPVGSAVIPADQTVGEITFKLTDPPRRNQIIELKINAEFTVDGKKHSVPVIPADEAMQAFAYTHLVAAEKFYCYTLRVPVKKTAPPKKAVSPKTSSSEKNAQKKTQAPIEKSK